MQAIQTPPETTTPYRSDAQRRSGTRLGLELLFPPT